MGMVYYLFRIQLSDNYIAWRQFGTANSNSNLHRFFNDLSWSCDWMNIETEINIYEVEICVDSQFLGITQ